MSDVKDPPLDRPVRVVLGVTGGIAAYKAIELLRLMRRAGWQVTVVMTRSARRFVGQESFRTLSGSEVATELFPHRRQGQIDCGKVVHVDLANSADLLVVAPATANCIGKLAAGIADDLLSTLMLAVPPRLICAGRALIAPAMNSNMWQHPSVRANVACLAGYGYRFVGPESGELACGSEGAGRMASPATIFSACQAAVAGSLPRFDGTRVLVTAGRTEEQLDPVRVITNRSSGRTGIELAYAFTAGGAKVELIAGRVDMPVTGLFPVTRVTTADEMLSAVTARLPVTDVLVMCAAVADYRPVKASSTKRHGASLSLRLERTPDILKHVTVERRRTGMPKLVVGFSLDDSLARAREKLRSKLLDLIVANPLSTPGSDEICPTVIFADGQSRTLGRMNKTLFAYELAGIVAQLIRNVAVGTRGKNG
ncbi:MAG: bifunctional phosphopantothenoylcysteine decarboxylase/phosphopantothenate--cysteine ligase CoaBC [candidate division WOR-3 bacterium]